MILKEQTFEPCVKRSGELILSEVFIQLTFRCQRISFEGQKWLNHIRRRKTTSIQ